MRKNGRGKEKGKRQEVGSSEVFFFVTNLPFLLKQASLKRKAGRVVQFYIFFCIVNSIPNVVLLVFSISRFYTGIES